MYRKHNERKSQSATRTQRRGVCALLIVAIAMVSFIVFPVTAYAGPGPVVTAVRKVLLADVPLYSQLDNVGTEWTSCGPTSLAMALNYDQDGPSPQAIIDYATRHTGQDGGLLYRPDDPARVFTSPQHLYEIAQRYGDPVQGNVADSERARQQLRALLADGLPVVADVTVAIATNGSMAAHFVTVTGIDAGDTVYVNDPYGEGLGGQVRAVAWEDFYWSWQNNSDGHVGGHGWWMVVHRPGERASAAADELGHSNEPDASNYPAPLGDLLTLADLLALLVDAAMGRPG